MQNSNNAAAYDFSKFENRRGNLAEKRTPQVRPHAVPKKRKSQEQLREEARLAARQSFRILLFSTLAVFSIGLLIYGRVQITELSNEITDTNKQIAVVESENTRLNMELDSKVSLDEVENYAINTLGMKKLQNYQIQYVNLSSGDEVITSGGSGEDGLLDKIVTQIKGFLSYVF